jgi:ABC-type polysaccharide/polyol phosphate export permease
MVPEKYKVFLILNPMTHLLEIYRSLILRQGLPDWVGVIYVVVLSILLLWGGQTLFLKLKPLFDDYL